MRSLVDCDCCVAADVVDWLIPGGGICLEFWAVEGMASTDGVEKAKRDFRKVDPGFYLKCNTCEVVVEVPNIHWNDVVLRHKDRIHVVELDISRVVEREIMSEHDEEVDWQDKNPPQHGERGSSVSEEAKQVWADFWFFCEKVEGQVREVDRASVIMSLMDFGYREREHRREVYGTSNERSE